MAAEDWIDRLARKFGKIPDGKQGNVLSYPVFEKAIIPDTITVHPCAITFTEEVTMQMAKGGSNVDMYRGVTELHLTPGQTRKNWPYIIRMIARVRAIFEVDTDLGGAVEYCKLSVEGPSIQGPLTFNPDTEIADQGLLVHWVVRERHS